MRRFERVFRRRRKKEEKKERKEGRYEHPIRNRFVKKARYRVVEILGSGSMAMDRMWGYWTCGA